MAKELLLAGRNIGIDSLIVMLMEGLVNMRPESLLHIVDFTGYFIPGSNSIDLPKIVTHSKFAARHRIKVQKHSMKPLSVLFQLPWMYLTEEERCSDAILNQIQETCRKPQDLHRTAVSVRMQCTQHNLP